MPIVFPAVLDNTAAANAALTLLVERGDITRAQADAARRARDRTGARVSDTLQAECRLKPLVVFGALAEANGLRLVDFRQEPPDQALLDPAERDSYFEHRAVPWRRQEGRLVVAVTSFAPETIGWIEARFAEPVALVVTTKFDLLWFLQKAFDPLASRDAVMGLYQIAPEHSARTTFTVPQVVAVWALLTALIAALILAPTTTLIALSGGLALLYLVLFGFRFVLTWVGAHRRMDVVVTEGELAAQRDAALPMYTVLVPMFRESEVLPILVESLRRLDYPLAKLDVKLVLEEGDHETIEAAKALGTEAFVEIIRVPHSMPKTKPKACNYALRFARGELLTIYDAEDIPDPDQLRKVVAVFRRSGPEVGCVQARLNYFNRRDNFLTRMFTLEYSHWFDYLLPGLHALRIPIPLGGTSNHFRTDVLRRLGAWDPFNVTEDADLGVRMTQQGYRVAVVNSTTFEEANGVLKSWINQRSRWIKGYMQTWLVHMRRPVHLYRSLGFTGFMGFHLFIGFPPLTALINPILWACFALSLIFPEALTEYFSGWVLYVSLFNILVANMMHVYFGIIAAAKRRYFDLVPWGLLQPAYWVLHSVAAYKALYQLIAKPHYWEKTQHGTSATTRHVLQQLDAGAKATA